MRTKLLFTIALLLASGFLSAQSFELIYDGQVIDPNDEIIIQGLPDDFEIVCFLDVKNTSSASIDALLQRYELDMVEGSNSAICWAGSCFPPTTSLSPYPQSMAAGTTYPDVFSGHYYPQNNEGVSTIAYTIYDESNPSDSVMFTVVYKGTTVSVPEIDQAVAFSVYPNPASDYLKVTLNGDALPENVTVQLVDATGAVVREVIANGQTTVIGTADLTDGIYLYRALAGGKPVASDKVVIKR